MKRIVSIAMVVAVMFVAVLGVGRPAEAGPAANAALGLAAFAAATAVVGALAAPHYVTAAPVYAPPPPVTYQPPPPVVPRRRLTRGEPRLF